MTTAQREARITVTEIDVTQNGPFRSVAPNGANFRIDYYTTVVKLQKWSDDPKNGMFAGRSYEITETYISTRPDHRGQFLYSSSRPW
jgi:hypothetical protein